ncbi:hypothetical protein ACJMK2_012518 [Sinanodonta woodiana]|uniref:NFX1-type zinc finger-containing protein 1 n=1 Tax=Sinanodonta woodiana TaxID=1069815 RepID=A0ABD3V8I0_SINWO
MKTMIDTMDLDEYDTTIEWSLIKSMLNHRSEDVSLEKLSTVLKAITESFERTGQKLEPIGDFRGELFAETLPILPDIDIIRQVKETNIPKHELGQKFENDRHYVSHMFVLFREDFIRPLCKGVRDYISYREKGSIEKFQSTDLVRRVYRKRHRPRNETSLWIWLELTSIINRNQLDRPRIPSIQSEYVPEKDIVNRDFEIVLDDEEDDSGKTIMPQNDLGKRPVDHMTKKETERVRHIWRLPTVERWRLYSYWREYVDASRRYEEARNPLDCEIMKDAFLQKVAPPVVIIEEAAQVSEQHVRGAIYSACHHLSMIGDHQQLRLAYNDYSLVRKHDTDQLENQHRMRPEILSLHMPHIYKSLKTLSRAREGLYVFGNMTCLRQTSTLWEKVISKAETLGISGKHFESKCFNHKENKMIVETPRDLKKYTEGRCYTCSRKCHNDDPDHKRSCKKVCEKYCENGHYHEKLCYESIGRCTENHEVILPRCGDTKVKNYFDDISEVKCDEWFKKELTCGHICHRRCGEVCNDEYNCTELVKVTDT